MTSAIDRSRIARIGQGTLRSLRDKRDRRIERRKGVRDAEELITSQPEFANIDRIISQSTEDLAPYHEEYVSHVSSAEMAVSLELAAFLSAVCELQKPHRILDLGSGFSSFVLRRWAMASSVNVWTVDDNSEWLHATSVYLEANNLPVDHLYLWSDLPARKLNKFDLVLHDLANTKGLRLEALQSVLDWSADGTLVLDDVHKPAYRSQVCVAIEKRRRPTYSLREFTLDQFGRYSQLVL